MTAPLAMLARGFSALLVVDDKVGQAEKDDVRAAIESDFDERVVFWNRRHDRVHTASGADPMPVLVREIRWLG